MFFCFVQKYFFGEHESQNIYFFLSGEMRIFFPELNIRLYDKNYLTCVFLTVIILTHGPMATSLLYLNQKILLTPMIIGRITITSSLGKVFNNVLNTRLDSFLTEHNLIPPSQVGFTKHAMVYFTFRNMFFWSRDLEFLFFPRI